MGFIMNAISLIRKLKKNQTLEKNIINLNSFEKKLTEYLNEIECLSKQTLIYGSLHYKKDLSGIPKYCYVIHTTKNSKKRKRDYIGIDDKKIKLASDAIERANKLEQLKNKINLINNDFRYIYDKIISINEDLKSCG